MKSIGNVAVIILGFVMGFFWVAGSLHSCNKHHDIDLVRYSPLAIFRGAEMFWHDDFKGVDWNQRQKNDAFILFQMMTTLASGDMAETVNNEVETFSERISKYPSKRLCYLKDAGHTFYRYFMTVRKETAMYLDSLDAGLYQFDSKGWNEESTKIEDTIVTIYGVKELAGSGKSMDSTLAEVRMAAAFGEPEQVSKNKASMGQRTRVIEAWMERIYQQIFNEPLITN